MLEYLISSSSHRHWCSWLTLVYRPKLCFQVPFLSDIHGGSSVRTYWHCQGHELNSSSFIMNVFIGYVILVWQNFDRLFRMQFYKDITNFLIVFYVMINCNFLLVVFSVFLYFTFCIPIWITFRDLLSGLLILSFPLLLRPLSDFFICTFFCCSHWLPFIVFIILQNVWLTQQLVFLFLVYFLFLIYLSWYFSLYPVISASRPISASNFL